MTGVLEDIFMKIWRNDKRVIKASKYLYCDECVLCGDNLGDRFYCLAFRYAINDPTKVCCSGYKYETDV